MIHRALDRLHAPIFISLVVAGLMACGDGDGSGSGGGGAVPTPTPTPVADCPETGPYACQTGATEPLYKFQWALNYAQSIFSSISDAGAFGGGIDLNVEPVHRQNIKGQGVNVLVLDSGTELKHPDLKANADYSMSWNLHTAASDPDPLLAGKPGSHGTLVAGIIAAAQNGQGTMGIAPLARTGAAAYLLPDSPNFRNYEKNFIDAHGGAAWSRKAHVINASFGWSDTVAEYDQDYYETVALRSLRTLRDGKGIVYVKAAGNHFDSNGDPDANNPCGSLEGYVSCINPANLTERLEPNVIVTAALNAKGQASSYSNAGSVVWVTGMGGETTGYGSWGEQSLLLETQIADGYTGLGPTIYSTDVQGCHAGVSKSRAPNAFSTGVSELVSGVKDNPDCNYAHINGTSAATATISGVVALMLSANPDLTWRDVRDILRLSARTVDQGYEKRRRRELFVTNQYPYNALFDLTTNEMTSVQGDGSSIFDGASRVPVELGWQTNAAGNKYSNWYGFGVPDAEVAVAWAQRYKKEKGLSKPAQQTIPNFAKVTLTGNVEYKKVRLLGTFEGSEQLVDQFQVRLVGQNMCLGSLGIAVESPAGTTSWLKMPLDHFAQTNTSSFRNYGLGSYAFYGESAKGVWKIYGAASNPVLDFVKFGNSRSCDTLSLTEGMHMDAQLHIEARVIAQ